MDIAEETGKKEMKPVAKKLKTEVCNEKDSTSLSFGAVMDELEEKNPKNPMLLIPVIGRVFKFLNVKDIKNCRLVSREWGSTGKLALSRSALFHLKPLNRPACNPEAFHSWIVDSATNFSVFKVSGHLTEMSVGYSWSVEDLTKIFDKQRKYIKDLTLQLTSSDDDVVNKINFSSWISKSPMVQKDAKYLTKLSIGDCGRMMDIPLQLIAHIKDINLSRCRINFEKGIKFCSTKLVLDNMEFVQDGTTELYSVLVNDVVDLGKTKELTLHCLKPAWDTTKYSLDLSGNVHLEHLELSFVKLINGKTPQWTIDRLKMTDIPYSSISMNNQMNIKELFLSRAGFIDFFTLPTSIQKLALHGIWRPTFLRCSQPIVMENLEYLYIDCGKQMHDFSFLSHFMNCPQLTHLKLHASTLTELKSIWIPKSVKTLILKEIIIDWLNECSWNIEKLVIYNLYTDDKATIFCETKIRPDDVVMIFNNLEVDAELVHFLKNRNRSRFSKRIYIGELMWDGYGTMKSQKIVLKEHVDVKSSFYVFENWEKGRAISKEAFQEVIPKHII